MTVSPMMQLLREPRPKPKRTLVPPGHNSKYTEGAMEEAHRRHLSGETQKSIAESFGVAQATISRWVRSVDTGLTRPVAA